MPTPPWSSLPWPVLQVDAHGEVRGASPALRALLGLSEVRRETLAHRFELFVDGRPLAAADLPWLRAARGERFRERETWYDRDTHARHLLVVDSAPGDDGGAALLFADESSHAPTLEFSQMARDLGEALLTLGGDEFRAADVVARQCALALDADVVFALAVDEAAGRFRPLAAFGYTGPRRQRGESFPLATSRLVREAVLTRQVLEAEDLVEADEPLVAPLRQRHHRGLRAFLSAPLAVDDHVLGLLAIGRRAPGRLCPVERAVLDAVRSTCARGLERAHARRLLEHQHGRLRTLHEAAGTLKAGLALPDVMRRLVVQACELTHATRGVLGLLNPQHTGFEARVHVNATEAPLTRSTLTRGPLAAVVREGRTLVLEAAPAEAAALFAPEDGPRSGLLAVPLRIGEEVLGLFYLADKEGGRPFGEEDVAVMELFSAQAALAVGYARRVAEGLAQRRLLEAVLHSAPDGLLFFRGPEGRFALGNAAAQRLLGQPLSDETFRSRTFAASLTLPDGTALTTDELPMRRALGGERVQVPELTVHHPDGHTVPVSLTAAPVRTRTGEVLGAVVALQDVSAWRELERLREEFAAVIAHDLRSPLQTILAQLELLLRGPPGQEQLPRALERMRKSAERLSRMVDDLLDASRLEVHRLPLERAPLDVGELAHDLAERLAVGDGGARVDVQVEDGPPRALADRTRMEQILTNLLENALKHAAGAPVQVRVRPAGDGVAVEVADAGPGIAPEDLPRLFDRFYQAERARQKRQGLGLGLYIARGLVEAHGGSIRVDSRPGEGTRFTLWFPAAPPGAGPRAPGAEPASHALPH